MSTTFDEVRAVLTEAYEAASHYDVINRQTVAKILLPGGYFRSLPDIGFHQPPVDFEEKFKMRGLSCSYVFPSGLPPVALQDYAITLRNKVELFKTLSRQEMHGKLYALWEQLTKDNEKTLGQLRFDTTDPMKLYHAVLGTASAFSPRDIQSWLDGTSKKTLKGNAATAFLINKIEICVGSLGWAPSLETLREIDKQISERKSQQVRSTKPSHPVMQL